MSLRTIPFTLLAMPLSILRRFEFSLALFSSSLVAFAAPPEPPEIASLRAKAEQGNSIAQYNLGLAYAHSRDVKADPTEAFVWLTLASENGITGNDLETLTSAMSSSERVEGQRRLAAQRGQNPQSLSASSGTSSSIGAELKELSNELALARQEANELKSRLAETQIARDAATAELTDSTRELAIRRAQLAKLDSAPSSTVALEQEIVQLRATATAMGTHNQDLEDAAALRGRTLDDTREQLARATAQLNDLNRSEAELKNQLATQQSAEANRAGIASELNTVRFELSDAQNDITETRTALDAERALTAKLQGQLDTQPQRLGSTQSTPIEISQQSDPIAELSATRSQLAQLKTLNAELQTSLSAASSSTTEAVTAIPSDDSAQVAVLTDKVNSLKNSVATLTREHTESTAKVTGLMAQLAQATAAPAALAALTSERDELSAALAIEKSARTIADSQIANLHAQLASPQEALAAAPASTDSALGDVEDKLATALTSFSILQEENDRLTGAVEQMTGQITSLDSQLSSAGSLRTDLTQQLTATSGIAAESDSLREQLRQTKDEVNAARSENAHLRTRLAIISPPPASLYATPTRPGSATATAVATPTAPTMAASGPRTHTVASSETLSGISLRYYGTTIRWAEILEANRQQLPNPRALQAGMVIVIP